MLRPSVYAGSLGAESDLTLHERKEQKSVVERKDRMARPEHAKIEGRSEQTWRDKQNMTGHKIYAVEGKSDQIKETTSCFFSGCKRYRLRNQSTPTKTC